MNTIDILKMQTGDEITKSEMRMAITESKKPDSPYYLGERYVINDTYQKGINWIGDAENPIAVIIKSKPGKYVEDETGMNYALQARKKRNSDEIIVNRSTLANMIVIQSEHNNYPLLYFKDNGQKWEFLGKFKVSKVNSAFVELIPFYDQTNIHTNIPIVEGNEKIIKHSIYERNLNLIKEVKKKREWDCDVCGINMYDIYGVRFIEAHHKVMISDYKKEHEVTEDDIALLCPNCHTITHLLMKRGKEYNEIKDIISTKLKTKPKNLI